MKHKYLITISSAWLIIASCSVDEQAGRASMPRNNVEKAESVALATNAESKTTLTIDMVDFMRDDWSISGFSSTNSFRGQTGRHWRYCDYRLPEPQRSACRICLTEGNVQNRCQQGSVFRANATWGEWPGCPGLAADQWGCYYTEPVPNRTTRMGFRPRPSDSYMIESHKGLFGHEWWRFDSNFIYLFGENTDPAQGGISIPSQFHTGKDDIQLNNPAHAKRFMNRGQIWTQRMVELTQLNPDLWWGPFPVTRHDASLGKEFETTGQCKANVLPTSFQNNGNIDASVYYYTDYQDINRSFPRNWRSKRLNALGAEALAMS